ncbi:hypothetical protein [Catellatospora sp. NPDC049609]|uniref:hypothetical protein n=1 Tax=Catellatospora sp. NPDC049609 TaxID=3155505 RepID=UPI003419C8C3
MAESPSLAAKVVRVLGIVAHLVLLPYYLASGLVAPLWAVILLLAVWAALLFTAIHLWSARPFLVPLVPIAAVAIWFAAISAGETWLGWTA